MSLLQQAALLAGLGASGFYIYTELEKAKAKANPESTEERVPTPTVDESGQTNITEGGIETFQQIDRTFAYTLLLKAHSDVTDFDSLTDSDLAQLLQAINIDPDVLRTHMTQEQADFLIHSAEEAARLRVEITIDQNVKEQWNTMIRAQKKQVNQDWAQTQRLSIDTQYAEDPYQVFYDWFQYGAEEGSYHGGAFQHDVAQDHTWDWLHGRDHLMESFNWGLDKFAREEGSDLRDIFSNDPYVMNYLTQHWVDNGHVPWRNWFEIKEGIFNPLVHDILMPLHAEKKQAAIDLLATQLAGKDAIVDSTDYVAIGYRVDDNGTVIPPTSDVDVPPPVPPQPVNPQQAMANAGMLGGGLGGL